jgi:RNase adaptor protein for sRNA GlmZ degradation
MKKRASSRRPRTYSEQQLTGLRASTSARKQETVERLRAAIESLKSKKQAITAQTIYAEARAADALSRLSRARLAHWLRHGGKRE